jgi:hypothetical protein
MLKAYTDHRTMSEIKRDVSKKEEIFKKEFTDDYFWDRVKDMDTKIVLEKLS